MAKKKHKVFVYGTLRPRTDHRSYLPATHTLLGFAMFNTGSGYPYITPLEGRAVHGNVIEATDKELKGLDAYENVDSGLYVRTRCQVSDSEGNVEEVFVYEAGRALLHQPIESGDWQVHISRYS